MKNEKIINELATELDTVIAQIQQLRYSVAVEEYVVVNGNVSAVSEERKEVVLSGKA